MCLVTINELFEKVYRKYTVNSIMFCNKCLIKSTLVSNNFFKMKTTKIIFIIN